jgi:hypothetical protein
MFLAREVDVGGSANEGMPVSKAQALLDAPPKMKRPIDLF